MRRILLSAALVALTCPCWAAELKLLGEAREHKFATVESDKAGPWMVLGPNAAVILESKSLGGVPVLGTPKPNQADLFPINGGKGVKFVGAPGWYVVIQWPPDEEVGSVLVVEMLPDGDKPVVVKPVDPDPPPPPPPPVQPTAATYIYDKDKTAPPPAVEAALDKINREKKIVATKFEESTTDGTGQTPDQYKTALAAARLEGLPALVVTSHQVVLRIVKNPTTEAHVLEAVKP